MPEPSRARRFPGEAVPGPALSPTHPPEQRRLPRCTARPRPPPPLPSPAPHYSIRDYASASYLQANWGLCQGQHKFQPVSLITARPTHWKL